MSLTDGGSVELIGATTEIVGTWSINQWHVLELVFDTAGSGIARARIDNGPLSNPVAELQPIDSFTRINVQGSGAIPDKFFDDIRIFN